MEDSIFPRMLLEGVHGKGGEPLVVTHCSQRKGSCFPTSFYKEAVRSFHRMIESPRSPSPRNPYDPMSAFKGENGYRDMTNRLDREVKFEPEVAKCLLTLPPNPFCCSTSDFLKGAFPSPDLSPQQGLGICVSFLGLL